MNATKGTNRLILDDMRWYLMIFSSITLMLTVVYLAIGFIFDVTYTTQLFGPMYGGICAFAIAGIITLFPVAIGMGSTRIQFMKSFYIISVWMVVGTITILNVIYFIMHLLHEYGTLGVTFYQPGMLYSSEYHFFSYLWLDLMIGFLVLGLSIFSTVCWIRLGMRNFFVLFFGVSLIVTLVIVLSDLSVWFQWFANVNLIALFTALGVIGGALLLSTYPMMKNAPLTMKGRKEG
ncbi:MULTISPECIES: hypothetical protein [unclassified Paenibacillus]|uniref:hypothetical protein n=1 Tax=unclassified Paenibacillus TaxID=185978 RepID=UPI0004015C2D|nr:MULTISPECIES: hypothetical protein [unclassified Paenibacillus]KGP83482.1 hypothetical protein P364_0107930 [Paenibacillus sp. MAEPY2]KGP86221.1 hypothetical protein P363_0118195 [Paenibacillus sp. MAEPY1]